MNESWDRNLAEYCFSGLYFVLGFFLLSISGITLQ